MQTKPTRSSRFSNVRRRNLSLAHCPNFFTRESARLFCIVRQTKVWDKITVDTSHIKRSERCASTVRLCRRACPADFQVMVYMGTLSNGQIHRAGQSGGHVHRRQAGRQTDTHACMRACTHACVRACMHNTYIHAYIHTYIQIGRQTNN